MESVDHDATRDVAYFTQGELLPWKKKWWQVQLMEVDGQKIIGLVLVKDTDAAIKRAERTKRWTRQHPRSVAGAQAASTCSLRLRQPGQQAQA